MNIYTRTLYACECDCEFVCILPSFQMTTTVRPFLSLYAVTFAIDAVVAITVILITVSVIISVYKCVNICLQTTA